MLTRTTCVAVVLPSLVSGFMAPQTWTSRKTARYGYLDDLSKELYAPDSSSTREDVDTARMNMDKEQIDRYGVGSWDDYVEFNEFDGGDGQMGVAGDGSKGLEKEWEGATEMAKSKTMSAKNAWGKSTGYAETLIAQGMEATRAQQMENWKNQQEVLQARNQHRYMTEQFDAISVDEDWRNLSKYGAERNQEFDLDKEFGAVTPGSTVYHHIELTSRIGQPKIFEFDITVRRLMLVCCVDQKCKTPNIFYLFFRRTLLWDIRISVHALRPRRARTGRSNLPRAVSTDAPEPTLL